MLRDVDPVTLDVAYPILCQVGKTGMVWAAPQCLDVLDFEAEVCGTLGSVDQCNADEAVGWVDRTVRSTVFSSRRRSFVVLSQLIAVLDVEGNMSNLGFP
jgi:hypothetical protein